MRRIQVVTALALFLLMASSGVAWATTVLRFTTDELADRADVVLHGQCVAARTRETRDGVVTDYDVRVIESLKGGVGAAFSFTTYGGVTEARGTFIPGAPTITQDEELLLFLDAPNKAGCRLVIGMAQGKFTVKQDEGSGRKVASRNLEGLQFLDPATGEAAEAKPEQAVPLDDLLARIRARVAEQAERKGR
jgi:hypothetical protein